MKRTELKRKTALKSYTTLKHHKCKTKRISPRLRLQIKNENELRFKLLERCGGLCERCHQPPDWRGLSLSHTKPKGMGGTRHVYTVDEVEMLCGKCHSAEHGIKEV